MPSDDLLFLTVVKNSISRVRTYIGTMTESEFKADEKTIDAVIRKLEVISEASRFLSDPLKARHPEIDWIAIRNAGNFYRHVYWQVTEERIWDTATNHLQPLNAVVLAELAQFDK